MHEGDEVFFKWRKVKTETGQDMDSPRYTILQNRDGVQGSEDSYSLIKNRKFLIPFFNNNYTKPEDADMINKPVSKSNMA